MHLPRVWLDRFGGDHVRLPHTRSGVRPSVYYVPVSFQLRLPVCSLVTPRAGRTRHYGLILRKCLAARGESLAAFDRRCIPPGVAQVFRPAMARLQPCPTTLSSVTYCRYVPSSRLVLAGRGIDDDGSRCHAGLSPRTASLPSETYAKHIPWRLGANKNAQVFSSVLPMFSEEKETGRQRQRETALTCVLRSEWCR